MRGQFKIIYKDNLNGKRKNGWMDPSHMVVDSSLAPAWKCEKLARKRRRERGGLKWYEGK